MNSICGIYKITSPSKRIYVGQSVDIKSRWRAYKNETNNGQTLLERSFKKYGYDNHKFEILQVCTKEELNNLEIYYIQLFDTFDGKFGLNLKGGGQSGGICSEAVKDKLRKPKPESSKEKYRQAALNRPPVSAATREKHRKRMLGNQYLLGISYKGKSPTQEVRDKISKTLSVSITGINNPNYRHGRDCKQPQSKPDAKT